MKKLIAILIYSMHTLSFAQGKETQTIKLGTLAPEGSVWYNALKEMGNKWETISNNSIKVKIYPGGVAGDDIDMVRKIRIGQLQGAALTSNGMSNVTPEMEIFQMPMLLQSDSELYYIRDKLAKKLEAKMEEQGFTVLYWTEIGWVYLFSNQKVTNPDDLKKLKQWVWSGSVIWTEALKKQGYNPVPLPSTEIHTGLTSGLIDSFSTTPVVALSYQWFGQAKNMMDMKWAPFIGSVIISTKIWKKLPEELKEKMIQAAKESSENARVQIKKLEKDAIESMQKYGLKVNHVTPAERLLWQHELEMTYPMLLEKVVPKEIYAETDSLLKEYRSKNGRK